MEATKGMHISTICKLINQVRLQEQENSAQSIRAVSELLQQLKEITATFSTKGTEVLSELSQRDADSVLMNKLTEQLQAFKEEHLVASQDKDAITKMVTHMKATLTSLDHSFHRLCQTP